MESDAVELSPKAFVRWSATLLAIAALLLPLFGPLLDHHLAERQPGHAHLYLGPVVPEHSHPYESRHHHAHDHRDGGSDNIVYFTNHDGIGAALAAATVYLAQDSLNGFSPEDDPLQGRLLGDVPLGDPPATVPWRPPPA